MIDWLKIALLLMQIVNKFIDWRKEQRALTAGEEAEVARQSAEIMRKTEVGRQVMASVELLELGALDELLRSFEPREPPSGSG